MHITCDNPDCTSVPRFRSEEVRGPNVGACKAELRKRGWTLGKRGEDRCGICRAWHRHEDRVARGES